MKIKRLGVALTVLTCGVVLAACSGKSSSSSDSNKSSTSTYSYVYTTDPTTLDYTVSSRQTNSDIFANFVDGLVENDKYGNIKPDLATSWKESNGGKTYTYNIRKGVKWVDSEGNTYGDVTAQDFVTGLKHAVAAKSETLYVVQSSITGLDDYVNGKTKDFSKVGVKAVGKYKLQYTLNQPESYWNSKLTYGVMFPVNAKFLKETGDDFGKMKPSGILYNGGYILKNFTAKSTVQLTANSEYWDKKNVHIKKVKLTYNDMSNPDSLYKAFKKGTNTTSRVYPNSAGYKDVQKDNKNNIVWSLPGSATYNFTFNLNRKNYDATDKKTSKEKDNTKKAIQNKNFRLAIQRAFDKESYNAQNVGKVGAKKSLRNEIIPPTFATVDGKNYNVAVEKELSALSSPLAGVNLADGQDGTYSPEKAKALLAAAKKELQAEGVAFPIKLDLPESEKSETSVNQAKSFKKSIESVLGKDNVQIDIQLLSQDKYLAGTYEATTGAQSDFDISNASGWSPDYEDSSSYLDIYKPSSGSMLSTLGLTAGNKESANAAKTYGLDKYETLLDQAEAETTDVNKRNALFAKASAALLDSGIQIPVYSDGGTPSVTKVVPFSKSYANTGLSGSKYKFMKLQSKTVTTAQSNKAKAAWNKERNKTAQAEADK
ncbi:oligopeptide ABC transporter substrate-binding protein [Ligilactobacillus salitolerans]|uniref:Oligopeptide ABC transporter substrate-binding protein n=1 Tax=Ligilactobacillus salitolerans TaxID=1808352 RepID=A0A401IS86_9LACO|nr:peptide ABC transporter substrate-binding protein [Ligilactobacillus salitolerans]GBG94400.1 oligopeptide ABC transporter substrate-binding protein [Ligilactobacillus salitolerans]